MIRIEKANRLEIARTKRRDRNPKLRGAEDTVRQYAYLNRFDRERLIRVDLDLKSRIVGDEVVSIGTIAASVVSPRDVFKGAILNNAAGILFVHNHPSGCPEPSDEDKRVIKMLHRGADLLDIPIVDFVIIGKGGRFWSEVRGNGRSTVTGDAGRSGHCQGLNSARSGTEVRKHER